MSFFRIAAALLALVLLPAQPAAADVFYFVAEDGTPHFSDQPTDPRFHLLWAGAEAKPAAPRRRAQHPLRSEARRSLDTEISAVARANRIDAALLHAVIQVESGYDPKAVSPKGALGLMQLMPGTARQHGVADPLDASQNLRGGGRHLRELLDQFAGDKALALAAYNAGAGAVLAHGRRVPPYAETTRYVSEVLKNYAAMNRDGAPR